MRYQIICEECDSEYIIEYEHGMLSDEIQYCTICKSPIEPELIEEDD